jgi:ADP-ribosylglycohydrolase
MIDFSTLDQKQTAMFGAMLGDALGVPHEFKQDHAINKHYVDYPTQIDTDYKTYGVPLGVYSDDFSQQLCVNANFEKDTHDATAFYADLLAWEKGKYWVSGKLFDEGMQTATQLSYYRRKGEVRIHEERASGNGSLMRVLPVAFICDDSHDMIRMAFQQSIITHNSQDCVKSCQFYVLLARMIADQNNAGKTFTKNDFGLLWGMVGKILDWMPDPYQLDFGSGYVIDTLNIVKDCIQNSNSYAEAVSRAILYGGDTDTNACVVGGIAALVFGLGDLPADWIEFIQPSLENRYVKELFHLNEEHV